MKASKALYAGSFDPLTNGHLDIIRRASRMCGEVVVGVIINMYVNQNGFDVVIRGLRATMDFEYEIQMAQMNARLYKDDVETVFLMTDPQFSFISSSMAKEVHQLGGSIQGLVPDNVLEAMDKKVKSL